MMALGREEIPKDKNQTPRKSEQALTDSYWRLVFGI
jgi:hypothetical protein